MHIYRPSEKYAIKYNIRIAGIVNFNGG